MSNEEKDTSLRRKGFSSPIFNTIKLSTILRTRQFLASEACNRGKSPHATNWRHRCQCRPTADESTPSADRPVLLLVIVVVVAAAVVAVDDGDVLDDDDVVVAAVGDVAAAVVDDGDVVVAAAVAQAVAGR